MPLLKRYPIWGPILALSLLLAACGPAAPAPAATGTPQPAQTATQPAPAETATATPAPRSLVICLGQEPNTLYPYGSSSRSMWSVLEAVYDGPIDTRGFSAQPVILKNVPDLTNGGAKIEPVDVQGGEEVVDANGSLVTLTAGTQVLPSGCSGPECALTWDGVSAFKMDHLTLTYSLLPGLTWSDGAPLTADDSVFSYQVASDPATPVSKDITYRTASYQALDETSAQWVGVPGYLPARYEDFFWMPFPRHLWGQVGAQGLLTADASAKSPVGWGPYEISEWVQGDHITLKKNPKYFRASEGLPKFDTLVYRFLGEPADNNLTALLTSECDVVDQTSLLDEQLEQILELQRDGKLKAYIGQGPEWEHVDFGIKPASYDDGFQPYNGDRPDLFSDLRVRQAFTYCMDRQGIADKLLFGQASVPAGFVPPTHPQYLQDLAPLPFDPAQGSRLLDEVGWKDADSNPATPRTALGVKGVSDGTALTVNYVTSQAPLRTEIAKTLSDSMAQCGIQLNVQALPVGDLYAPGPNGVLFGRNFDLAEFAWEAGNESPCYLYDSNQVPTAGNDWMKVNVTGYSNPAYDSACQAARLASPAQPDRYNQAQSDVQRLFAQELPSVPLYFRLKMAVSRPDLCGLEMDVTARSDLWNLESLDYGQGCQ